MTMDYLEKQLASYQRLLLAGTGAAVTLLATAVADIPNHPEIFFPGWYAVWFILQLATIMPAVVLLLGSELRKLPFASRLNTISGFLAIAWVVLAAFGIKLAGMVSISLPVLAICLGGIGAAIAIAHWLLHRSVIDAPEAMFP